MIKTMLYYSKKLLQRIYVKSGLLCCFIQPSLNNSLVIQGRQGTPSTMKTYTAFLIETGRYYIVPR